MVPLRCPWSQILVITSARHLIFTSIMSHTPFSAPLQRWQRHPKYDALPYIPHYGRYSLPKTLGGCSTCAVYCSLVNVYTCIYVIRCAVLGVSAIYSSFLRAYQGYESCPTGERRFTVFILRQESLFPHKVGPLHRLKYPNCPPVTLDFATFSIAPVTFL